MPTNTVAKRAPKKAQPKQTAKRKPAAPKEPPRAAEVTIELPARLLADVLKNALVAACKDQIRPILCAAAVQCEDGFVRVVSTDSYRLLVQQFPVEGVKPSAQFIVDRAALTLIERLARAVKKPPKGRGRRGWNPPEIAPQTATVKLSPAAVEFASNGTRVEMKAKSLGEYPNWQKLTEGVPAKIETAQQGQSVAVNGEYLSQLANLSTLTEQTSAVVVAPQINPLSPVRIEIVNRNGYRVYALLMPVRTS